MRTKFQDINFKPETLETIVRANSIIAEYTNAGYRMTLRQLYYQFVSRDFIQNTERSYKKLAKTISDARLAGMVDWNAIEDRGRVVDMPYFWSGPQALLDACKGSAQGYSLDKWRGQPNYVELWVEKQALAGVLEPLASQFCVPLMVNKGYSSQSAMYEASLRFRRQQGTKDAMKLFYLGDHDPSGEDMVRDITDRLTMFGVRKLSVVKLALTMDQIQEYEPPPNPAKMSDPRAGAYVAEHGDESWEVDALPPNVLGDIIRAAFEEVIDDDALEELTEQEESERAALVTALENIELEVE